LKKSFHRPLDIYGSQISFYRNIVRQNVSCEKGLNFDIQLFNDKNNPKLNDIGENEKKEISTKLGRFETLMNFSSS